MRNEVKITTCYFCERREAVDYLDGKALKKPTHKAFIIGDRSYYVCSICKELIRMIKV